jgi:hypothetical protein
VPRYRLASLAAIGVTLLTFTGCSQSSAGTPSRSPSAVSTLASSPAPSATPVPQGFRGLDLTFVSASLGWVLGEIPCPALAQCAAVEHTSDSGASWSAVHAPTAAVSNGNGQIDCLHAVPCVDGMRFGSATAGYAFGPALFHTLDGGQTWQQESSSTPTLSLEYAGRSAFRIAGYGATLDCFGGCHIQRAAVTGGPWTDTGIVIPMAGAAIVPEGSQRIYGFGLANSAGGASNKKATVYYSRDGGVSWNSRADPCPGNSFTVGAATAPTWHLAILCRTDASTPTVLIRSDDGGLTFHSGTPVPVEFTLTMGSATTFSGLTSASSAESIATSFDSGAHWRVTLTCPNGPYPVNQVLALGYQDARTAHVICPESTVWRSQDGGATWNQARF